MTNYSISNIENSSERILIIYNISQWQRLLLLKLLQPRAIWSRQRHLLFVCDTRNRNLFAIMGCYGNWLISVLSASSQQIISQFMGHLKGEEFFYTLNKVQYSRSVVYNVWFTYFFYEFFFLCLIHGHVLTFKSYNIVEAGDLNEHNL